MSLNIDLTDNKTNINQSDPSYKLCEKEWLSWYENIITIKNILDKFKDNSTGISERSQIFCKLRFIINTLLDTPKDAVELKCTMALYLKCQYINSSYEINTIKGIPWVT